MFYLKMYKINKCSLSKFNNRQQLSKQVSQHIQQICNKCSQANLFSRGKLLMLCLINNGTNSNGKEIRETPLHSNNSGRKVNLYPPGK